MALQNALKNRFLASAVGRGDGGCLQLCRTLATQWTEQEPLSIDDPEIKYLVGEEKQRQLNSIELVASENFCSKAVLEALGSCLTNKYADGYPGQRHYSGTEVMDKVETLCQNRALEAFDLDPSKWGVNVQTYSGSPANIAVFTALLKPHERIMGLDVQDGGHLTHGCIIDKERVSATSIFFESMPYRLNPETGVIDYDLLAQAARLFQPNLIIAGTSTYCRLIDYKAFKEVCTEQNAVLMGDMSHISGLVAANLIPSPFNFCDVVTTTTHKTLRGPRGALIFFRKGVKEIKTKRKEQTMYDYENKINCSVHPKMQGGPHMNTIAAIAVALRQATAPAFRHYQEQVLRNAKAMATSLLSLGYNIVTGGTDNHQVLVDLRPKEIDGARVETVCNMSGINVNKIQCAGVKSMLIPVGLRLGVPALTSRNLTEQDFEQVAKFLDKAVQIALQVHKVTGTAMSEFDAALKTNDEFRSKISQLKSEGSDFISKFPMPGFANH